MSRKVILTEAQFRDYMRFQLKENNNKQINTNKNTKKNN
jgi:hypothetical protein